MYPANWKPILNDIEKERAVLLIGPDFLPYNGASIAADFYIHLKENLGEEATKFFVRDGLFYFDSAISKLDAKREAELFYQSLLLEESVLTSITELPFSLIISVNPDLILPQFFSKHQLNFQFDYFTSKTKATSFNLSKPTATSPLIYNLCGSMEDLDSLILDFDDMFELLKNLLGDFGIPQVVNDTLVNASTYIFIGFQFEKWHTQLLLRYLNKNRDRFSNAKKNYATKTIISDENTKAFFQQQFNLTIYGGDWTFLAKLHEEYSATKQIRSLINPLSDRVALVRRLIQFNNIEEALERLEVYTDDPAIDLNELTMYKANYYTWLSESRDRLTSQENLDKKIALIRMGLLDIIKKMSKK